MILCMQYWEGDKADAMRIARLIADTQPKHTKDHRFMFVRRFDASEPDPETVGYVARKFDVLTHASRRKEVGWPAGCNGVASDVMMLARERFAAGKWRDEPLWLLESDVLPLRLNWLESISREWDRAREAGKLLMGAWSPHHGQFGHINGNMVFHPSLAAKIRGLEGSASHIGWDVYHAHRFRPHWWKSDQMANFYRATNVQAEFLWPEGEPLAFVHGIKDLSGYRLVRQKLFSDLPNMANGV